LELSWQPSMLHRLMLLLFLLSALLLSLSLGAGRSVLLWSCRGSRPCCTGRLAPSRTMACGHLGGTRTRTSQQALTLATGELGWMCKVTSASSLIAVVCYCRVPAVTVATWFCSFCPYRPRLAHSTPQCQRVPVGYCHHCPHHRCHQHLSQLV
jgi:hypothetical protein